MVYDNFAAGYLVKDNKVLLVHHRKFDKWVPPGGHIEMGETPEDTVVREFWEETRLNVKVITAFSNGSKQDSNCTPLPIPFQMGVYTEGFKIPHIGYFYFVKVADGNYELVHRPEESIALQWFNLDQIKTI